MIGTPIWRVVNYGFISTFKYFFTHRLGKKSSNKRLETLSLAELAKLLRIDDLNPEATSRAAVVSMMNSMRTRTGSHRVRIKNVLEEDSSISRLIVLEFILRSGQFKSLIETGTQHGLSAYVAGETSEKLGLQMNISSFDVSHNQYFIRSAGCNYFLLSWPVRRKFKKQTLKLANQQLIFFHDSDHSYENMFFEFSWAWKKLKAEVIISDDIDGNDAFYDFCKSNQIMGYRLMIDTGPAVGFAMRSL